MAEDGNRTRRTGAPSKEFELSAGHPHVPQAPVTRRALLAALGGAAGAGLVGCRSAPGSPGPSPPTAERPSGAASVRPEPSPSPVGLPRQPAYVPVDGEVFRNAKTTAARFLEALMTYTAAEPPAAALERALVLAAPDADRSELASRAAPVLVADAQSTAQVVYPQLGGLVPLGSEARYAVVMVVLRHRLLTSDGERREATRTIDVRLRVVGGAWAVEALGSVGGDPVPRPRSVPESLLRVLENPRIVLPDSARWDLHSGKVDGRVVGVMADLAERSPYSVTVLRSGHPEKVVDGLGDRSSNHFLGRAVDVWALDDVPVVQQRGARDSAAYDLLEQVIAAGPADEVGVPVGWDLDGPVRRLFDNAVHNDHFHVGFRRPPS